MKTKKVKPVENKVKVKKLYRITIRGESGYKEYESKHELRLYLMRYLINYDITGMNIKVINR